MDQEKVGKFILNLRKRNHLTQKELADSLNVTSQAVSKWENGRGLPDIETLKKLSELFHVDIKEILDGEEKKKRTILHPILLGLILGTIIVIMITSRIKGDFNFKSVKSTNKEFEVEGVVAYSKDKKSIYISNIKYLKEQTETEKYVIAECNLYEIHEQDERKIATCGNMKTKKKYQEKDAKELSELLKDMSIKVDNYSSMCKNLTSKDLYIIINVINDKDKTISYKIPLSLNKSCEN